MLSAFPSSRLLTYGLLPLFLAGSLAAQPPSPESIADPAITAKEVAAHVGYLASQELAGRGSGTSGNNLAGDYLAERFKAFGLKPAGESGGYFQQFSVFTGIELGAKSALTIHQGKSPRSLKVRDEFMPLSFTKNGAAYAPVVFAGYGISKPDLGYDDYAGIDVKGKIVLVLRYTPDMDEQGKFGPYAQLAYKTMTAREKGAAGILLLTGPLGDNKENLGRFVADSASADCGIPAGFIKADQVDKLLAPTQKTVRDLQIMIAHGKTQSFLLPGVRIGMRMEVERQTAPTRNVLGFLEGSDPKLKDQVVVIGAHYDHLGMGGSHSLAESTEPAIHHGADDNASGTAGVLELAQYFASNREKAGRSLLFMGFSGEEIGLIGSAHWTKQPTIPLERIAAMVNLDMVGRMKNDTFSVIGIATSKSFNPLVDEVNKGFGFNLQTTGPASGPFGGSDQQSFYIKGIPVLFFFTGVHPDYHRPSDTADKVNNEGTAKLLRFVADTTERLSKVPEKPDYVKIVEQTPQGGGFNVYLGTIPDYAAEAEGVTLQGVREGGPAAKAGIKAGDIIVELGGKKIRNVQEYTALLGDIKPDVAVKMVVLRGADRVTLMVTPTKRRD